VDDEVTGSKRHTVTIRWHLASRSIIRLRAGGAVVNTAAGDLAVDISASGPVGLAVESRNVAIDFEATTVAPVLTCRIDAILPVRVTTYWRRIVACRDQTVETL
jgi:hypothetical protein